MTTVNIAMKLQSKGRSWVYVTAAICLLVLAGTPASASAGSRVMRQAPCASRAAVGALGREGGLLSLRGHDGSARAVAAIVHAKGSKIQLMPEGYVAYVGSQCLGVDGGLMGVGK